jgi:hypothetical protein
VPMKASGQRSLLIHGVELKVRTGWSPIGVGYVRVLTPGQISSSSAHPGTDKTGVRARLPLAVHNHWIVLRAVGADPTRAFILLLASGDAAAEQKRALEADVIRRAPDVLARLNAAAKEEHAQTLQEDVPVFGGSAQTERSAGFSWAASSDELSESSELGPASGLRTTPQEPAKPFDLHDSDGLSPWGNPRS